MLPEVISMREPADPMNSERILLTSGRYVHFGPFRIDQQRQEVTRNGSRLKLQGKVYQVLLTLLEKPGEVVTREELRTRLWPADTHVNYDANVNTTVNKLRQALGDSSDKPLLTFSKSDVWVVLGVIGLILAGMLLGAGITRLLISHAAPVTPYHLAGIVSHSSSTIFF